MKTKLLTICLLLFTSQAFAGWTEVGKNSSGTIFYVDFDRTKEHNGYKYFYMLGDYLTPYNNVLSTEYYIQLDCNKYRYRHISFIFYDQSMGKGNGRVDNEMMKWENITKGTMNYTVSKKVCDR